MLINKRSWQDAGMLFEEAGDGGAGAGNDGGEGDGGTPTPTLEEVMSRLAETEKALKAANREAKERRERLEAIEAAEKQRQESELSELEKERKRAKQLEDELNEQRDRQRSERIQSAVAMAATKLNFIDPDDAHKFADLSSLEVDDSGKVNGVDDSLKALAKAKPYLVKQVGSGSINANDRGRATEPTIDDLVARQRASGMYQPI